MSATSVVQNVKDCLYNYWDAVLAGIAKAGITWATTRKDVPLWTRTPGAAPLIAVYNPGKTMAKPISASWWQLEETITVHVLINATVSNMAAMLSLRLGIRNEILRIIHKYQTGITGVSVATITGEPQQVEAENMLALVVLVKCTYFHQKT